MARIPDYGGKPKPGDRRRRDLLDELYAGLPKLECAGKCAESCGPIALSRVEWQRICRKRRGEARAVDLTCPLLEEDRCSVYELRPLLCRLWGMVEKMKCPWGCVPERYLSDEEASDLMKRVQEIDSTLVTMHG